MISIYEVLDQDKVIGSTWRLLKIIYGYVMVVRAIL